mmetsp:Transcript_26908/g.60791  ORF Transcript_26908/g.60791 Transcript_26908/m.60791 type:complete len:93 (+) Transcript_26908:101-379(+)
MATAGLEQPPPIYQAIHTSMHVQKEVGMQIAADCMQIGLRPSFTPAIAASLRVGTTYTSFGSRCCAWMYLRPKKGAPLREVVRTLVCTSDRC